MVQDDLQYSLGHNGDAPGMHAAFKMYLNRGYTIVSLSNNDEDVRNFSNMAEKNLINGENQGMFYMDERVDPDTMNSVQIAIEKNKMERIAKAAYIPAVGYAYVEPMGVNTNEFTNTTIAVGKKSNDDESTVDENTRFPASSLSKIVFTYLVLQWANENNINLDEPLESIIRRKEHETSKPLEHVLRYKKFLNNGEYPEQAKQLTIRHILSHTSGLPNVGSGPNATLPFNSIPGEKYSYSGEAFYYLQSVIEAITGNSLEDLAKQYVFEPLKMEGSTFLPQAEDAPNSVKVHTELGKVENIYMGDPPVHAAGSLLTTTQDFSKFIAAWFKKMEEETLKGAQERIFTQAFVPMSAEDFPSCGLGWHIYKNPETNEVIAYQYGQNPSTRSFVAINVKEKKGAAFFTNAEHGMSIATQLLGSPDFAPIGDMQALFRDMANNFPVSPNYPQSDEPGWQETLAGKIAEDQGRIREARDHFEAALEQAPEDIAKHQRLAWFNEVHLNPKVKFTPALNTLVGKYKNNFGDNIDVYVRDGDLILNQFDHETKLVRISDTDFLPEKDQSQRISLNQEQMSIAFVHGGPSKNLSRVITPQSQYKTAMKEVRESDPSYLQSTDSSELKKGDKHIGTAPKSP